MTKPPEFQEIIVLAMGRSGTNLLLENLRNLQGNIGLFEIFSPGTLGSLENHPAFFERLQANLGRSYMGQSDPALLERVLADQIGYFDILSRTAQEMGFQSISCKIFPTQASPAMLQHLLARPNVRILMLTRRRIDRYLSRKKGVLTQEYIGRETTNVLLDFDLTNCLTDMSQSDRDLAAFLDCAQGSGRPLAILGYERDLDQPDDLRHAAITAALAEIGVTQTLGSAVAPDWLPKQDKSPDWRHKVKDGFAAASALVGLGLLDYVESAPLMDLLPSRSTGALSKAQIRPAATLTAGNRGKLGQRGGYFESLGRDPLVTVTAIQDHQSILAEWMIGPEPAFAARKGVHFLRATWSMETQPLDALADRLRLAELDNPGHIFVALHVNAVEAENYRKSGIRSILGSSALFTDETLWASDAPPLSAIPKANAVMIAGLADWKNHHLAALLGPVHFIYAAPSKAQMDRVLALCPQAHMVNHILGKGQHLYLDAAQIAGVFSRSKLSLALSFEEGAHRGSMESLLAGLPVVSVAALGGRDAFYSDDNALIVAPNAQAVRDGVDQMVARRLTRAQVRKATLALLLPARHAFEQAANAVIQDHLGPLAPHLRVRDLVGLSRNYRKLADMTAGLQ